MIFNSKYEISGIRTGYNTAFLCLGADLANICNEAAIYAARENDNVVGWKHLNYAIERVTSGMYKISFKPFLSHCLPKWLLKCTVLYFSYSHCVRS